MDAGATLDYKFDIRLFGILIAKLLSYGEESESFLSTSVDIDFHVIDEYLEKACLASASSSYAISSTTHPVATCYRTLIHLCITPPPSSLLGFDIITVLLNNMLAQLLNPQQGNATRGGEKPHKGANNNNNVPHESSNIGLDQQLKDITRSIIRSIVLNQKKSQSSLTIASL